MACTDQGQLVGCTSGYTPPRRLLEWSLSPAPPPPLTGSCETPAAGASTQFADSGVGVVLSQVHATWGLHSPSATVPSPVKSQMGSPMLQFLPEVARRLGGGGGERDPSAVQPQLTLMSPKTASCEEAHVQEWLHSPPDPSLLTAAA